MFKMIGVLLVLVSVLLQSHATDESCAITFKTWDLEKMTQPSEFARPRDEESVVQLVQEAAGRGEQIKVIGGGLSFTGVQFVDANAGAMFSLSHMNAILHVDAETFEVEVQAGITIRDLVQQLGDDYKLALPNLGATASQSIVGAAATGTVTLHSHSHSHSHLHSHSHSHSNSTALVWAWAALPHPSLAFAWWTRLAQCTRRVRRRTRTSLRRRERAWGPWASSPASPSRPCHSGRCARPASPTPWPLY